MGLFDHVADEYDAGRPVHPPAVYDLLEPLNGRTVLDVGAGTGIATRQLIARGASVIAVDHGPDMLARAVANQPGLPAVLGDGASLPVCDGAADLVCFAQSWHWMDPARRAAEVHRVLADGGRWAAWWSHARADGARWFDDSWSLIERWCPGTSRIQRDVDWAATIAVDGGFRPRPLEVVAWDRRLDVTDWLTDLASHSYIAALDDGSRRELLAEIGELLAPAFPGGAMTVPYETHVWLADRR